MADAIGRLLPLAVAMAISSVPILVTVLILLSPNARRSSFAFMIGWIVGIALVFTGCVALSQVLPTPVAHGSQEALGSAMIVIGVALVALAVIGGLRARRTRSSGVPRWMNAMGSLGPVRSAGVGLILNLRPKSLLLCAAAGLAVRSDRLASGELITVVVLFTLISASSVIGPVVVAAASPQRAQGWLRAMRAWIERNSAVVTTLILLLIGVVVIGDGITRL